jgi:hypothetical protein
VIFRPATTKPCKQLRSEGDIHGLELFPLYWRNSCVKSARLCEKSRNAFASATFSFIVKVSRFPPRTHTKPPGSLLAAFFLFSGPTRAGNCDQLSNAIAGGGCPSAAESVPEVIRESTCQNAFLQRVKSQSDAALNRSFRIRNGSHHACRHSEAGRGWSDPGTLRQNDAGDRSQGCRHAIRAPQISCYPLNRRRWRDEHRDSVPGCVHSHQRS